MSQHDYVIANNSGAGFRADVNSALAAIVTQNAGPEAPSTTFGNMSWYDSSMALMRRRDNANAAWIVERTPLPQTTFYVSSAGSDATGNGLSSASAFRTIQKAINHLATFYDTGSNANVTVQIEPGTWSEVLALRPVMGGARANLQGNVAAPLSCTLQTSLGPLIDSQAGGSWTIAGMTLKTLGSSGGACIRAAGGQYLLLDRLCFGGSIGFSIDLSRGATADVQSLSITGNSPVFIDVHHNGRLSAEMVTITLSGALTFSSRFALVRGAGILNITSINIVGSATGQRFLCTGGGVIESSGIAAQNTLPGNVAGTTQSGGCYI